RKLVCILLHIHKGLVFGVAENGGVGNRDGVRNRPSADERGDEHVPLQFLPGILGNDARLQGSRGGIQGGGNIGNLSVKEVGIGFGVDFDGVSNVHERKIALVDVHE